MVCRTIALFFALVAAASAADEDFWGPPDSMKALDAVVGMVDNIVKNAKSPESLKKAQTLAADIKADIEAVESGKLSKDQAKAKVGDAIKEMTAFQASLKPPPPLPTDKAEKLAKLEKELAEKKAELAKDENMIKLIKLKKELAEKKLKLQGLLDQKQQQEKNRKADQEEAAKTNEMVKSLVSMAKASGLKAKEELPAPLKTVLATVESRRQSVADDLKKMEVEEKTAEAKIDSALEKRGKDADVKEQGMLKRLKKEEHRKFAKAQAIKRIELNELKDAEASIESRDIAGLQKVMSKLETEGKALQAKAGFLY